jgi:DNA mismatch repair protein MutS2
VRVRSLNQRAIVQETVPGNAKHEALVVVRAGSMSMKVPVSDLEIVQGAAGKSKKIPQVAKSSGSETNSRSDPTQNFRPKSTRGRSGSRRAVDEEPHLFVRTQANTVDLRGQRVEEAIANLERFIDSCVLAGTTPVMIIHGHGTGAVRQATRSYLEGVAHGNSYRPGETYEGGDGVTIVEF